MQFIIDNDHPSLPGHFPNHPVVPAVVILNYVLAALAQQQRSITGIKRLKFLRPVLPGQPLRVEFDPPQAGRQGFKCWAGEILAVEGQLTAPL